GLGLSLAEDLELRPGAGGRGGDLEAQRTHVADGLAVEGGEDVAGLEPGPGGGGVLVDLADEDAAAAVVAETGGEIGGEVLEDDAEVAADDAAVGDEALHDVAGHVDGDGEADAHVSAGAGEDGGVD